MADTITHHPTQTTDFILYAKLDSAKVLYNLVKSVNFKDVSEM
jgi:hypothetical protein